MSVLSKEEEQKYFLQMQEGMRMALEATHFLGGRMTITYDPPMGEGENPIQTETDRVRRITIAKQSIDIFKAMLDGMTAKQLKEKFNLSGTYMPGYYFPVQCALFNELEKKRYDEAPFQPRGTAGDGSRIYDYDVRVMRRHKDFILKVLAKANEEKFLTYMLRYIN
jgi:hypothetical protein